MAKTLNTRELKKINTYKDTNIKRQNKIRWDKKKGGKYYGKFDK